MSDETFSSESHRIAYEASKIVSRHHEALDAFVRDLRDAGLLAIGEYGVSYSLLMIAANGEKLRVSRSLYDDATCARIAASRQSGRTEVNA